MVFVDKTLLDGDSRIVVEGVSVVVIDEVVVICEVAEEDDDEMEVEVGEEVTDEVDVKVVGETGVGGEFGVEVRVKDETVLVVGTYSK